ncbi:6-bladed beta-propeller [Niabella sp. 22666]|uniref:6-bladed beta-propeller n=1 Tax=Niabella sp. 22666 TaxID=3453954 RepID=UPI003F866A9C
MRYIFISFFFLLLLTSCRDTYREEIVVDTDSQLSNPAELLEKTSTVILDPGSYKPIQEIDKVFFSITGNKRIFIVDLSSESVTIFTDSGKFVNQIRDSLIQNVSYDFDRNEIHVLKPFDSLLNAYDINGRLVESRKLKNIFSAGTNLASFKKDYFFDRSGIVNDSTHQSLTRFNSNSGTFSKAFLEIPAFFNFFLYTNNNCFDRNLDTLYYLPSFHDTVYTFNESREPIAKYWINLKNRLWHGDNDLSVYKGSPYDTREKLKLLQEKKITYNFDNFFIAGDYIHFSFFNVSDKFSVFYNHTTGKSFLMKNVGREIGQIISKSDQSFVSYKKENDSYSLFFYNVKPIS